MPRRKSLEHGEKGGADIQVLGRSHGGLGTKIHVAVDALGCLVHFMRARGYRDDVIYGKQLLDGVCGFSSANHFSRAFLSAKG